MLRPLSGHGTLHELLLGSMADPTRTAEVWSEFSERLLRWFGARAASGTEAEELLQETFLRIHTKLPALRDEERLGPWVQTIARNVLADSWRTHRPESAEDPEDLPDTDDTPSLTTEVAGWLPGFLAQLADDDRRALELVELEGAGVAAVAAELDLSLTAAKSRVQRARHKLRDTLDACCRVELDAHGEVLDWERRTATPGDCAC